MSPRSGSSRSGSPTSPTTRSTTWLRRAPFRCCSSPVFNPVRHMVPPPFPLLLVPVGLAIDLVMRRVGPERDWRLSALLGAAFVAVFFVTQWFFAEEHSDERSEEHTS